MDDPTTVLVQDSIFDLAEALFTPTAGPVHADAHGSERFASAVSKVKSSAVRCLVLAALAEAGDDGHTDAELERLLEEARPTPGNRRGDLVKLGAAEKAHRKRPHPVTSNPCEVWRLTADGFALAALLGGPSAIRRTAAQL